MYKTTISGTVNTRQDEHQFDDASSARKSLDMGQDVHQPTFEDGVQTGVTIIPYHAVDVAAFAYSTTSAPDPVDANCVEHESGGCETLYEGDVTFTYNEEEEEMVGTLNMTGSFTVGSTVNVTLDGGEAASGTIEDHDGMLGATLSVGGNVVGAIFTVDGVTNIMMPGVPGDPVTMPVKVEQCSSSVCSIELTETELFIDPTVSLTGQIGVRVPEGAEISASIEDSSLLSATPNGEQEGYKVYTLTASSSDARGITNVTFCISEDCCAVCSVHVEHTV